MHDAAGRKLGHRVLHQERAALSELLVRVLATLDDPAADSPRARDVAWMRGESAHGRPERLQSIAAVAVDDLAGILLSADEHVELSRLCFPRMRCCPSRRSHWPGLRRRPSILFCYFTDPGVSPEARLARAAALRMHTAQENQKTQGLFGDAVKPGLARNAADAVEGLHAYFNEAGLELRFDKDRRYVTSLACDGQRAPLTPKTTELSARYIPTAHNSWIIGSWGHALPHLANPGLEGPRATELVAAVVFPLLDVADALVRALCAYVGHDPAPRWAQKDSCTARRAPAKPRIHGTCHVVDGLPRHNSHCVLRLG